MTQLDWFPKRFGPGDIDGHGAKKLLGTPDLPPVSVLVRETAQNSWDARVMGADEGIDFVLHLRKLTKDQHSALRGALSDAPATGLKESLAKRDLHVLEVIDRGTVGLGGPTRNDLALAARESTNFIDFVLNVGAHGDAGLGGGTYGFGKTISYVLSRPGTIVIWSKVADTGEHRLIASAMGDNFEMDGKRYTGRHWWGHADAERIEPLVGGPAAELGSQLFDRQFADGEAGTSLLIIDPDLGSGDSEVDARRLAVSALWNLWPKLMGSGHGQTAMRVSVMLDGDEVPIPDPRTHAVLGGFTRALDRVREAQRVRRPSDDVLVPVEAIKRVSPAADLGHLALTRFPFNPDPDDLEDVEDLVPISDGVHHVALMRHQAELVVGYERHDPLDTDGFGWAGVFKPHRDVDRSFAEAEPPAHDAWIPKGVSDRDRRSHVNVALSRISEAVRRFVHPPETGGAKEEMLSGAALSDALADLMGLAEGSRPLAGTSVPGVPRGPKARAVIGEYRLGEVGVDGQRRAAIRVEATGPVETIRATASLLIGFDGGSEAAADRGRILGWAEELDADLLPTELSDHARLRVGQPKWVIAVLDADLAFDVDVRVEKI